MGKRHSFSTTVTLLLEPPLPLVLLLSQKEEIKTLPAKYAAPFCTYCIVSRQPKIVGERPSSTSSWHGWLGLGENGAGCSMLILPN